MADSLGIFKQQKYKEITINDGKGQNGEGTSAGHLSPATTDGLANNAEAVLSFFHVPSETDLFFKAFITTFAETYGCDWTPDTVFGRTDPIFTFKNTTRNITLGWKIPSETISEAYENLGKLQKLAQFLYPNYTELGNSSTVLSQSPLVRVQLMNLLPQAKGPSEVYPLGGLPARDIFRDYISSNNPSEGLLCVINSMNINHNLENREAGVIQPNGKTNTVLPKLIEISMDLGVIHEHTLGWDIDNTFKDPSFPYNAILESESESVMSAGTYDERIAARQAEEQARVSAEQDRANAVARGYNGMFGEAFRKKDENRLRKLTEKAGGAKGLNERQKNKMDYLASAQRGYVGEGKTNDELVSYAEEILDYLE